MMLENCQSVLCQKSFQQPCRDRSVLLLGGVGFEFMACFKPSNELIATFESVASWFALQ